MRNIRVPRDLFILLVTYGVLAILPAFLGGNLAQMGILIIIMIYVVVASEWDLIMGYAGVFIFSSVALFAIGAYSSAILAMRFGVSPWLAMPAAGAITAGVGALIGLPCLRLKGTYVALVTFGFHMMLIPLINSNLGRAIGTGGAQGLIGIPPLSVGGYTFSALELVPWFYVTWGISFACLFIIYKIIHSPWGLAFVALRDAEPVAKASGIDDYLHKVRLFAITSFFTGLIGGLYAHYSGVLSTLVFTLALFLMLMIMQVIGGMGQFPGTLLGGFIIIYASEGLRAVGVYRLAIFGAIVVAAVVGFPGGIMSARFKGLTRPLRKPAKGHKLKG